MIHRLHDSTSQAGEAPESAILQPWSQRSNGR
jgi:hypothetical protein